MRLKKGEKQDGPRSTSLWQREGASAPGLDLGREKMWVIEIRHELSDQISVGPGHPDPKLDGHTHRASRCEKAFSLFSRTSADHPGNYLIALFFSCSADCQHVSRTLLPAVAEIGSSTLSHATLRSAAR